MKKVQYLFIFLLFICSSAFSQDGYLKKIKAIADEEVTATKLLAKLDSIKRTRRPTDSNVKTLFNRSVDFGYYHQRIDVRYNGKDYHINLLTKNDTILFSKTGHGNSIFMNMQAEEWNKTLQGKVDTIQILRFLKERNKYYGTVKTIKNVIDELTLNETYALYCGDGAPQTGAYAEIIELAKKNDQKKFSIWLTSICCEEQAYATLGYKLLRKNRFKVDRKTLKLVNHINQRKSAIVQCSGCFVVVN
nr:hypothetical protein [uncultured Mucilaginibacter sp.]